MEPAEPWSIRLAEQPSFMGFAHTRRLHSRPAATIHQVSGFQESFKDL